MLPVVVRTCFQSSGYCIFIFICDLNKNLNFMIFVLGHLNVFLESLVHTEYKAQLHASAQFVTSLCVLFLLRFASLVAARRVAASRSCGRSSMGRPQGEIRPTLPCNYALSYACFSVALLSNSRRCFDVKKPSTISSGVIFGGLETSRQRLEGNLLREFLPLAECVLCGPVPGEGLTHQLSQPTLGQHSTVRQKKTNTFAVVEQYKKTRH